MSNKLKLHSLNQSGFGAVLNPGEDHQWLYENNETNARLLKDCLNQSNGLLVIKGLEEISQRADLLVDISYQFGREVENYLETPTPANMIHEDQNQILILSNLPPCERKPPARPDPALNSDGTLPVQFPHRTGWHTDQSFRRPPPDISLFYAVLASAHGQGQTLFADGYAAYQGLPEETRKRLHGLNGLHALLGTGRNYHAVVDGIEAKPLKPHQASQLQPLVRIHPETGKPALYLCEYGQMDWLDGPVQGLDPGPESDGAELIFELMTHYTRPEFTYIHEWDTSDLVIYDNRCLVHCATWYDEHSHDRLMWRTTVHGNPGPEYAGEKKSWIPESGENLLEGLGDGRWDNLVTKR